MPEFHGNLLIGGMTLKHLFGTLDEETCYESVKWCGELIVDLIHNEHLELGRTYRLELEDGRSGKIAIKRVGRLAGKRELRVVFDGLSSLERRDSISVSAEPAEAVLEVV